jgi:hypothetical protein
VVELAVGGSTNAGIAAALLTGVSTVRTHLTHVYAKLAVINRNQLSLWLATAAHADQRPASARRSSPPRVAGRPQHEKTTTPPRPVEAPMISRAAATSRLSWAAPA